MSKRCLLYAIVVILIILMIIKLQILLHIGLFTNNSKTIKVCMQKKDGERNWLVSTYKTTPGDILELSSDLKITNPKLSYIRQIKNSREFVFVKSNEYNVEELFTNYNVLISHIDAPIDISYYITKLTYDEYLVAITDETKQHDNVNRYILCTEFNKANVISITELKNHCKKYLEE